jgi:hypothetical protein
MPRISRYFLLAVITLAWPIVSIPPLAAALQEQVDCTVIPCGPSGAFTRDSFPTIAEIDFKAFPSNPARPYKGRTWYVSTNGSDQASGTLDKPVGTIIRALELAQSGDAIQVGDGAYRMSSDSGISLNKPGITLFAEHVGGATLQASSDESFNVIDASADNLTIDGFIIRPSPKGYGIYFGNLDRPQRNLVLKNLIVEGGEVAINSVITQGGAVNPQPVIKGLLLHHVLIRNPTLIGFNCGQGPCNDMRLENLVVQMPRDTAIETSGADAVAVESGDNILVFNADISGASADGIDFKATRVAVVNSRVHAVLRNGIKFWHGGDIVNTLVFNTGADASIVFDGGGAYRLLHVIVARHEYRNPGSAYAMSVAADHPTEPGKLTIQNSIFYQNSAAIWVSGKFSLDVRYNIFFGSGNGQELVWQRGPEIAVGEQVQPITDLEAAGGGCCNPGFIDPKFTNPDQGDFSLASNSPARDAGATDVESIPDFDMPGKARTAGKAPDLGPVEAQ